MVTLFFVLWTVIGCWIVQSWAKATSGKYTKATHLLAFIAIGGPLIWAISIYGIVEYQIKKLCS